MRYWHRAAGRCLAGAASAESHTVAAPFGCRDPVVGRPTAAIADVSTHIGREVLFVVQGPAVELAKTAEAHDLAFATVSVTVGTDKRPLPLASPE